MTGIRARLADALQAATQQHHGCRCKACADDTAKRLLSLPDIAIVDVEADIEWIAERMADADDGIIYGLLTPDEAEFYRRMARAALAAAVQAQEEQQ